MDMRPLGHDIPPDYNNPPNMPLAYWKAEAESAKSRAQTGAVIVELVELLVLGLSLPIRLPLSWWLKQRRKRKREVTL
jgi:hypothetical protein